MENKERILLVEDDKRLGRLIRDYLTEQGFDVDIELRGDTAEKRIIEENPDLVILDLMLPGLDGMSVCRNVRNDYHGRILMLTAKEGDFDHVAGLETGADDYVKKPVDPRVLLARVRAVLRRGNRDASQPFPDEVATSKYSFGKFTIDSSSRTVSIGANVIELTTAEFDLIWFLASYSGQIVDRDRIYLELKGIPYDGLDRSVDVMVSQLRKKLGDNTDKPERIKTVWGKGYLFVKDAWGEP